MRWVRNVNLPNSSSLCNKLYTYLYHHIVVLDKYIHSILVSIGGDCEKENDPRSAREIRVSDHDVLVNTRLRKLLMRKFGYGLAQSVGSKAYRKMKRGLVDLRSCCCQLPGRVSE